MHHDSTPGVLFSPENLATLASFYDLPPFETVQSVAGGLTHRLYRVETGDATFALKVLSHRAIQSTDGRARLERAENVAAIAHQNGIPAITAIRGQNGAFLQQVTDEWIVLYPWQDGHILPPVAASQQQCHKMGQFLGQLHALKIRFPDQSAPIPEAFGVGHWETLSRRGESKNAVWASALREALPRLVAANEAAMKSQLELQNDWVTGHLDFDQKNVLWNNQKPTILDWESAKPIHPALELLGAGLSWAGQSAGDPQKAAFQAFLNGYRAHNCVADADLGTACEAVLGKWLIWLEFNMVRSLEPEIRGTGGERICHDALFHALGATLKLQDDVPLYREWCTGV